MLITSGKVVSGKIVVDGDPLPDGAIVTVLAREADETFELDFAGYCLAASVITRITGSSTLLRVRFRS